jgi:hypothetical protein
MRVDEKKILTYKEFLTSRNIDEPTKPWPYFRQGVVMCWTEPGFHNFWRKWNPLIGYFTYRLYVFLGGKKRLVPATLVTFIICGFAHDLVGLLLFKKLTPKSTIIFILFSIFTLLSKIPGKGSFQEQWPTTVNVVINLVLVWISFRLATEIIISLSSSNLTVSFISSLFHYLDFLIKGV